MRTTTFKCDRCGTEDTTNQIDILNVGVHVGGYAKMYSSFNSEKPRVEFNQDWCFECRIKTGLREKPVDARGTIIPVTLEDLVREIAYKAASEAIINSR